MQKVKTIALGGGLDLVTPPSKIPAGRLIGVNNYEPGDQGGYRRIAGFERFNGLPSPSDASYWVLNFDAGDIVEPEVTGICTGATSGAMGEVGLVSLTSGTWAGGTAVGFVVLFDVTGDFIDNETLSFGGANDGFSSGFSSGFS